jgi:hypothetical protein
MNEITNQLILQAIEPGMTIPEDMKSPALFLLNLKLIVDQDVWDDYGNKELAQAYRLRDFADRIIAIAEKLDQLGAEFKCFPDANDYDEKSAKSAKLYDEAIEAANAAYFDGYRDVTDLVDKLAEAAIGDFMD